MFNSLIISSIVWKELCVVAALLDFTLLPAEYQMLRRNSQFAFSFLYFGGAHQTKIFYHGEIWASPYHITSSCPNSWVPWAQTSSRQDVLCFIVNDDVRLIPLDFKDCLWWHLLIPRPACGDVEVAEKLHDVILHWYLLKMQSDHF